MSSTIQSVLYTSKSACIVCPGTSVLAVRHSLHVSLSDVILTASLYQILEVYLFG